MFALAHERRARAGEMIRLDVETRRSASCSEAKMKPRIRLDTTDGSIHRTISFCHCREKRLEYFNSLEIYPSAILEKLIITYREEGFVLFTRILRNFIKNSSLDSTQCEQAEFFFLFNILDCNAELTRAQNIF